MHLGVSKSFFIPPVVNSLLAILHRQVRAVVELAVAILPQDVGQVNTDPLYLLLLSHRQEKMRSLVYHNL